MSILYPDMCKEFYHYIRFWKSIMNRCSSFVDFSSSKLRWKKYAETTQSFQSAKLHRKTTWKWRENLLKFGLRQINVKSTSHRPRFNVVCPLGIVFNDMNADFITDKKLNPIVTELFIIGIKVNIYLAFIT